MKKLVTCAEMKDLDSTTIREIGVPSEVLMERAALKVVEETEKYLQKDERILVVCGSGNNGGRYRCCQIVPSEGSPGRVLYGRKQR